MTNQALTLEFDECAERFLDRSLGWFHHSTNAEIDQIARLKAEVSQLVVSAVDQFLARKSGTPGRACAATSIEFGDDDETVRVGMKRPLDNLIGYMLTVVVAGIDVIHAGFHRLA